MAASSAPLWPPLAHFLRLNPAGTTSSSNNDMLETAKMAGTVERLNAASEDSDEAVDWSVIFLYSNKNNKAQCTPKKQQQLTIFAIVDRRPPYRRRLKWNKVMKMVHCHDSNDREKKGVLVCRRKGGVRRPPWLVGFGCFGV